MTELLHFEPDSKNPITESIIYNTDRIESFDGTEQRIPLLQNPRNRFSYYYTLYNNDLQKFNNFIFRNQSKEIYIPIWTEATEITNNINVSSTTVNFDFDYQRFQDNCKYVIMKRNDLKINKVYTATIVDLNGGVITSNAFTESWEVGDLVIPVSVVRIRSNIQKTFSQGSDRAAGFNISFQSVISDLDVVIDTNIIYPIYKDLYIIDKQPNKVQQVTQRMQRKLLELDLGYGKTITYDKSDQNFDLFNYNWTLKSKQEISELKAFANSIKGKLEDFWFPTFQNDMYITGSYINSDNFINIEHIDLEETYLDRDIHIKINFTDGTYKLFQVTLIENMMTYEKLTLDGTLDKTFDSEEVDSINLVWKSRFNNDEFLFSFANKNIAQIKKSAFQQKF